MVSSKLQPTQFFAIAALFFYALFFVVSQNFYTNTDPKLAAVLSWAHYGSILPRLPLWYLSIAVMSALVVGLLAVALNRRWGTRVVLVATVAAIVLIPFSGVSVFAASARFVGSLSMVSVFSLLAIAFVPAKRK